MGLNERFAVGEKWDFGDEDEPTVWEIKAINARFAIMTAMCEEGLCYSIIDRERMVRGPHNLIFNFYHVETQEGIDELMRALVLGECEVSRRTSRTLPVRVTER